MLQKASQLIAVGLILGLGVIGIAQNTAKPKPEPGWSSNLDKALAEAKKSHRIVMVDFNATWCGPCQMYKKDVFPTADFKKATKDVILVEIDTDEQPTVARKFKITAIPDIRLIAPSGKQLSAVVGYGGGPRLIDEIQKAKKSLGR